MNKIRACNIWDDDYKEPTDADKARGECAKLYMELRDLEVRLDDIKYHQLKCRQFYTVCIAIAVCLFLIALVVGSVRLFYHCQPIDGLTAYIVNGGILFSALIAGISTILFCCAMSVNSFCANCADFLRIEKLEMKYQSCIREKNNIERQLKELERMISEEEKTNL